MGHIFVLAVGAAFYPTLFAAVILILTRPRPLRLLVAFLVGGMGISIIAGFGIVTVLKGSGAVGKSGTDARPVLNIVAGVVSLAVALAVQRGRGAGIVERRRAKRGDRGPSFTTRALGRDSLKVAFLVGVVLNLPGVWYLAALADIAHAKPGVPAEIGLVVAFNLVMFLAAEVPLGFYLANPERAELALGRFNGWLHAHMRDIGVGCAAGIGVYLLVKGIVAAV